MPKKQETNSSTEEKIKKAARIVFMQKGYAATRTRDIAEQAGINLALLNYYFRSKEKLFELIMFETGQKFFMTMKVLLNEETTSVEQKLELLIARYIDMLLEEPNFPFFMLSEIQANPEKLIQRLGGSDFMRKSFFFQQLGAYMSANKLQIDPIHYIINIIGITIFPFLGKPLLKVIMDISDEKFRELMIERKKLIPVWIQSVMQAK